LGVSFPLLKIIEEKKGEKRGTRDGCKLWYEGQISRKTRDWHLFSIGGKKKKGKASLLSHPTQQKRGVATIKPGGMSSTCQDIKSRKKKKENLPLQRYPE